MAERIAVHAGGIAVVGDLLYVADTVFGVRLFRLGDVMRVEGSGAHGHGWRSGSPWLTWAATGT